MITKILLKNIKKTGAVKNEVSWGYITGSIADQTDLNTKFTEIDTKFNEDRVAINANKELASENYTAIQTNKTDIAFINQSEIPNLQASINNLGVSVQNNKTTIDAIIAGLTSGGIITFKGAYVAGTTYTQGQMVSFNTKLYLCVVASISVAPPAAGWEQIDSIDINIDNYYTKLEVDALLNAKAGLTTNNVYTGTNQFDQGIFLNSSNYKILQEGTGFEFKRSTALANVSVKDPTANAHCATKGYVDGLSGERFIGEYTVNWRSKSTFVEAGNNLKTVIGDDTLWADITNASNKYKYRLVAFAKSSVDGIRHTYALTAPNSQESNTYYVLFGVGNSLKTIAYSLTDFRYITLQLIITDQGAPYFFVTFDSDATTNTLNTNFEIAKVQLFKIGE